MKKTNPEVEAHIFKSVENVNINQIMGYYDYDKRHNYYDDYDEQKYSLLLFIYIYNVNKMHKTLHNRALYDTIKLECEVINARR